MSYDIDIDRYNDLPEPEHDASAGEALERGGADANPDADCSFAIDAAEERAKTAALQAADAFREARAFCLAANHARYDGPATAAAAAATSCERAAARATDAWQAAYEAADDAGAIAHADPEAANQARKYAACAAADARLTRRCAYDARQDADRAEAAAREAREKRSAQRTHSAPGDDLDAETNDLLLKAHAAFTGLAASASDEEARAEFADRRDRTARLLHARGAWPWAVVPAETEDAHECPACGEMTRAGLDGPDGLCETCAEAEAEKGQA